MSFTGGFHRGRGGGNDINLPISANDVLPTTQRQFVSQEEKDDWNSKETSDSVQSKIDIHANRTDNPHSVTKEQIGLGNVDNVKQASKQEFDTHNNDNIRHITQQERDHWNDKVSQGEFDDALDGITTQLMQKANQSDLDEINQNIKDLRNNKADKVELEGIDFQIRQINGLGTEVRNIYVDVNTGDDEQGDGSESNPFKTIQKAVDTIPKIINKDHHIICKPGTYDEEVVVQSIFGAGIFITCPEANQDPTQPTGFSVVSISFYDCGGYCVVQNMDTFKGDVFQARAHIVFSRCFYGSVGKCRFDSGAKNNGNGKASVLFDGSVGSLQSNHWHNQHRCLHVMNGSQVRVDANNTSTGDSIYGMTAQAATIYKNGQVSFTAQIPEQKLQGGQIW